MIADDYRYRLPGGGRLSGVDYHADDVSAAARALRAFCAIDRTLSQQEAEVGFAVALQVLSIHAGRRKEKRSLWREPAGAPEPVSPWIYAETELP